MTTATTTPLTSTREPALAGQTVVVIGGSAGIGLEAARQARSEGADVVLTGRSPERLTQAARQIAPLTTAAFDATDGAALQDFFEHLSTPVDHVMVTAGGSYYSALPDMNFAEAGPASTSTCG